MLIGPQSTAAQRAEFAEKIKADPRKLYCAADDFVLAARRVSSGIRWSRGTSTCGRMCCTGDKVSIVPGGLTRVALKRGSLVVNSSQGGGSKDTWVLSA